MRVITEPTVLPEGEECSDILNRMIANAPNGDDDNVALLSRVLQQAFDEGRKFEAERTPKVSGSTKPKRKLLSVDSVDTGVNLLPELTSIASIMDEGPENPVERFRYDQTPPDDANVALWESQLQEALKYTARIYTG
ncbi:hypothetical protein [uncultured Paraglaciecola sp.]|uniref:hypothetical protein n=1 Tax=uncultured Paraglaciecola sp. TaxID=1765024 RepID=UPI002622A9D8|nr:hypothetical protein [uncultured Paraglaciecola sp.]